MCAKQRTSRHERLNPPPRMQMTQRDEQVLEAVYHYRVLTQAQIRRLIFATQHPSVAQRRLYLLFHNGYLTRQFIPTTGGLVTSPILYLLDQRGSQYIIQHLGYDEMRWQRHHNQVSSEFLTHLLDTNTFRVEVTLACQHYDIKLLTWHDDTTLKQNYDTVRIAGSNKPQSVIPDGYFLLQQEDRKMHFFVELDRGTMEARRFQRKVKAYLVYRQSELARQRFGTKNYRVLTVCLNQQRATNLKQATEAVGGLRNFWFGVLAELQADTILSAPQWQVASLAENRALIADLEDS